MLTHETLIERLHYDPETGVFTWIKDNRTGKRRVGDIAGSIKRRFDLEYLEITIDGRAYQAHRLAIFYMTREWPPATVDHKDGNGLNNCLRNIRPATLSQNAANAKLYSTNTSGFKGVTWNRKSGRWQAGIKINGRSLHLGLFDDPAKAHAAYYAKAREIFGDYARTT